MGIGMVLAVAEEQAEDMLDRLRGLEEQAWIIGEVASCSAGSERVELVEG
jgi:phosphoribosylformylglycinamidine cyclo-ligase